MLGFLGLFGLTMGGLVFLQSDDDDDQPMSDQTLTSDGAQNSGLEQMLDASEPDVLAMVQVDDSPVDTSPDDADADVVGFDENEYVPMDDGTQNDPRWVTADQTDGTDQDDTLTGSDNSDTLDGAAGDDTILGKEGDDTLSGGEGNDLICAGDGADVLNGDAGDDSLEGSWGNDTLFGGEGRDTLFGGWGDDRLSGVDADGGQDFLNGGDGDDVLMAGQGDVLHGGEGDDLFVMDIDAGAAIADYEAGTDTIEVVYQNEAPELTTETDDDGLTLLADGIPTAHLLGVSELDLESVVLTRAA